MTWPIRVYMLHTVAATIVISFLFPRLIGLAPWAIVMAVAVASAAGILFFCARLSLRYFESPMRVWLNSLPLTATDP